MRTAGDLYYRWIIIAASFLIMTIAYGAAFSFGVFLTPLRNELGWSSAAISGAYSTLLFFYTTMGVLAGWGVDKYGPRTTTIGGGIFIVSGLLLITEVRALWHLYIGYAMIGTGLSSAYSPLMTTVSRWCKERRGLALGIIGSGISIGPLIVAPLATHIIFKYDWRLCFLIMASGAGIIILAAFLLKRSPDLEGKIDSKEAGDTGIRQSAEKLGTAISEFHDFSLKEAVGTSTFWLLSCIFLLTGFGLQMVMAHIVACAVNNGIDPMTAAAALSTVAGCSIAGRVLMGMLSDRIGRRQTLAICVFAIGVSILGLAEALDPVILFASAAVFGFGYGGQGIQLPALTGETLGLSHMGSILGAAGFFWGVGGGLGTLFAGFAYDMSRSYTSAFAVASIAMLSLVVVTFLLKVPTKRKNGVNLIAV
jgi:MFS family permease